MSRWPLAVFAHNEGTRLLDALRSIDTPSVHAYVLANGCTDATERVATEYADATGRATVVSIALGDKANAWNVFVHERAPAADVYFFMDGDVTAEPGACEALARTLEAHPEANAAAAVPASGRSRARQVSMVVDMRLAMGALYALRGTFVAQLRQAGTRIPVGYIGDDGWVTSMAKWDGDPARPWDEHRVAPCLEAGYRFRSLSPARPGDWKGYWNRHVRYAMRHFQHILLRDALLAGGLPAMPRRIADLYSDARGLGALSPRLSEYPFDWVALRRMRAGALRGVEVDG